MIQLEGDNEQVWVDAEWAARELDCSIDYIRAVMPQAGRHPADKRISMYDMSIVRQRFVDAKTGYTIGHRHADGSRWCRGCETFMPIDRFSLMKSAPDSLAPDCKGCYTASAHGISMKIYRAISQSQNDECAICGRKDITPEYVNGMNIDHDHAHCPGAYSCGSCIRGLLCRDCNTGLGSFGDSPERLQLAAQYLEGTYVS